MAAHQQVVTVPRPAVRPLMLAWLRSEQTIALLACAALAWVAQFHRLLDLGLYEDDYWFIAQAMGKDLGYLAERSKVFVTLPQGRPLGFFLPDLFSFIGDKVGGLPAIYVLGFLVVTLNAWLCFRLLRVRMPAAPALAGAALFCLFPADTTKILLTHDFQLQPSLTFLLLASLAYASGRLPLAYVLSVGSLLTYENGFLPFLGIPLLLRPWSRATVREMARHVLILGGIFVVVVVVRLTVGEDRAVTSAGDLGTIVPRIIGSIVIGPARALALFGWGPLRMLPTWDLSMLLLSGGTAVVLTGLLYLWRGSLHPGPRWREIAEIAAAGIVLLCLAYVLAFTHYPPTATNGRGTSVHLGATVGAAVLFASFAWAALRLSRPLLGAVVVSAYLALAGGYYMTIARDFADSWQVQRAFWHEVAACCSDLRDGTVVLAEWDGQPGAFFIFTNSWADPLVLERIFRIPREWTTMPRLFSITDWRSRLQPEGDGFRWLVPEATWDEHWEQLPQGNVILLRREAGHLVRVEGSVDVDGHALVLKSREAPAPLGHGPLWTALAAP